MLHTLPTSISSISHADADEGRSKDAADDGAATEATQVTAGCLIPVTERHAPARGIGEAGEDVEEGRQLFLMAEKGDFH